MSYKKPNSNPKPGAQVLAHSLRDAGTTKKLVVLAPIKDLKSNTIAVLNRIFDIVIDVEKIYNHDKANLNLMGRLDLNATFTKIHLWRLTQFRKIVYLDADTVALRAPDELFDLDVDFAVSGLSGLLRGEAA